MKIAVVAGELPHPEGTAAGRDLWAWCEGARQLGHDVRAWLWMRSPSSPPGPAPPWCDEAPFVAPGRWRAHARAVLHPRQELELAGWCAPDDAVAVADHLWSFAAVRHARWSVATMHFRSLLDARAVGSLSVQDVQMARAERLAGRHAGLVLAYSQRVGAGLRGAVAVVPIAFPVPPSPLAQVEEPVTALLADWSWPPNRRALSVLLRCWPEVRHAVPGARLLLAGRNLDTVGVGSMAGVELLGAVGSSDEVLGQAAVVAFPCPPSSGPKVKVLEACAYGRCVVTTASGVEGLAVGDGAGAVVAERAGFASALSALLRDPARRAWLAAAGRQQVKSHHAPVPAAAARVTAMANAFGLPSASSTPA